MDSIKKKEQAIIEEFSMYPEWMDKYELIIDMGKSLAPITENSKTEENIIKGCQSRVWLDAEVKEEVIVFTADSDAIITKGIIALLLEVINNEKPQDIVNYQFDFLKVIGLQEHLSPNRANGLVSMIKQIKAYALVYANK